MAVRPLLSEPEQKQADAMLHNAVATGEAQFLAGFHEKLGFKPNSTANTQLVHLIVQMMQDTSSDFTMTFRQLAFVKFDEMLDPKVLDKHWALKVFSRHPRFKEFLHTYKQNMIIEGWFNYLKKNNLCIIVLTPLNVIYFSFL